MSDSLRKSLADCGIVVSTHDDATILMSMPMRRPVANELIKIEFALAKAGQTTQVEVTIFHVRIP